VAYPFLFGYLFFGPANIVNSIDLSVTALDTRFPRYWRELGVAAGGSRNTTYTIAVPTGITPSVYFGNFYLIERGIFGSGRFFERSDFGLTVL
jgi:hypothetical protein